ncbi:hypothetical protein LTR16_000584 [Cryomyces antarcticus]|uniref:DUF7924 domain-containing protein n=1 Tax=Cryomyces antarcticus TaxID=329879 RepID=A0ABR0M977_9PEZI|nr:hypothetical protein LTR16_000584 [Cryomyces antarcticus]
MAPTRAQSSSQRAPRAAPRNLKRKLSLDIGSSRKRGRQTLASTGIKDTFVEEVSSGVGGAKVNPVEHWTHNLFEWPKEYFEPECKKTSNMPSHMSHLLARKKLSSTISRDKSESISDASSDTTSTKARSAQYQYSTYAAELAQKGNSFMSKSNLGITDASKALCQELLEKAQTIPKGTKFDDDRFEKTCERIRNKNEAKVVQDVTRLIVPSVEDLADIPGNAKHLDDLIESVDKKWANCIPVTMPRPEPDYAAGFAEKAFTAEQLEKLTPWIGGREDTSYFRATKSMYFPFLTCEVKRNGRSLEVADRQNAHSMTIAVRAVVELFKEAKREQEVNREILAFSVSHDHQEVKLYGHYAVIGDNTAFYRHPIRHFIFTEEDGSAKWTAYQFTKNIYDNWVPTHLKKICSAVDELPRSGVPEPAEISDELELKAHSAPSVGEQENRKSSDDPGHVEAVKEPVPRLSGGSSPIEEPEDHQLLLARNADNLGDARPTTPDTSPSEGSPARRPLKRRSSTLKKEENKRPRPPLNGVFDGQVDQGNGSLALPS